MKAPVHRCANKDLFAAAAGIILAYLETRPEGATHEALRDNLAARCRGPRYFDNALKALQRREAVVLRGKHWLLAERKAA